MHLDTNQKLIVLLPVYLFMKIGCGVGMSLRECPSIIPTILYWLYMYICIMNAWQLDRTNNNCSRLENGTHTLHMWIAMAVNEGGRSNYRSAQCTYETTTSMKIGRKSRIRTYIHSIVRVYDVVVCQFDLSNRNTVIAMTTQDRTTTADNNSDSVDSIWLMK